MSENILIIILIIVFYISNIKLKKIENINKLGNIITDYSNIFKVKQNDFFIKEPNTIKELFDIIKDSYNKKNKVRIRGGGHSCSGISIPKKNEIYINMKRLIRYNFNQVGTILVEAGICMNDLRIFLKSQGFELPVYPHGCEGNTSPTVGGFICAGGISFNNSYKYGGFWENVLEITIINGSGQKKIYNHNDEIFPWLFANYGQLGVIVSAKLKIYHIEKIKDFYPLGKKGIIKKNRYNKLEPKYIFYHILCSKKNVKQSEKFIENIISSEYFTIMEKIYFSIKTTFIPFKKFNPPLLYKNKDFYVVGGFQKVDKMDNKYKEKLKRIENKFSGLIEYNTTLNRYPQVEYLDIKTLKNYYIQRGVYNKFLMYKKQMDPNDMFNQINIFN